MSQRPLEPEGNRLLAMLPQEEMERLLPHLEQVSFALGEVVYESGGQQSYIFFPTTAIFSLLYMRENGSSAEMGVAGNEGLVGVALFMGGNTVPNRAVVQSAGDALRMKPKVVQDEYRAGRHVSTLALALHAGADDQDVTDRCLQSPPHGRAAALPLAATEP